MDVALEHDLFSLVLQERWARDKGDWDALSASYWPDSFVRVTWFEGTSEDFVAVSAERKARGGGGMHTMTPVSARAHGDRALVESRGQILIRPRINGVEVDVTNWCRFFSRVERRGGEWRLLTFDSIYVKDRIDPVMPGATLELDANILDSARRSYRYLTYLNRQGGYPVSDELPGDDRPELVAEFYADAEKWMLDQTP